MHLHNHARALILKSQGGTGGGGGAIGGFSSPGAGAAGPKLKEHLASTQEHTAAITGLLIMGSDLYSSGKDGQIIVWAYSGTTLTVKHKVPTSGPAECLLAAEPYLFAGVPGGVQCWNMTTNASQNMEHPPLVHCLATCPVPNGAPMLLSGGADGGIRIWKNNPQSGQWEGVTQLTGHNGPVMSLSISNNAVPGTSLVVSGGQDNTCRLWVPQNPNAPVQTLTEAQGWVMGALEMQLSTGVYLCTGSLDTKVKVYQYQAGNNVSPFTAFFEHEVHKSVQESGMQVEQGACQVTAMLLTEDSQGTQVLATALTGGVIMVWDVPTFEKRDQVMCGPPNMSIALMALPKQLLIAGAGNGQVFMWQWG